MIYDRASHIIYTNLLPFLFLTDVIYIIVVSLLMIWFAASLTAYILLMCHRRLHSKRHSTKVLQALPPLSMVVPLAGYEDGMDECIRSYFNQIYPSPVEIVFALSDNKDPALGVAKAIQGEYPNVPTTFVISHQQDPLANPKFLKVTGSGLESRPKPRQ